MSIWQLSWNFKNYDAIGRMAAASTSEDAKHLSQSWGRSPITNISKIKVGDTIYISCQKKCIGKAVITREFYPVDDIKLDEFTHNQSEHSKRHDNRWYCDIYITDIYTLEDQQDLRGNQKTFCNPTKAFWKK